MRVALIAFVLLVPLGAAPIDREALVRRHNPVVHAVDPTAPLTVGNGQFAFTVDVTGLQTFGPLYHDRGIPIETMARWCWVTDENPNGYKLADANRTFTQADGTPMDFPTRASTPAGDWLRRNPRQQPLGQLSLEWSDGRAITPEQLTAIEQTLDLWTGVITSRYQLDGVPVVVTTAGDSANDAVAVRIESELVATGRLCVRLAFPRGYDPKVKNTPALDWSAPESHRSTLTDATHVERTVLNTTYHVASSLPLAPAGAHAFTLAAAKGERVLAATIAFSASHADAPVPADVIAHSTARWRSFWSTGGAVDFTGSTNPLARKFEERIVLSRYLTAVQCAGEVPPQESGLTCSTWYGKHHTEMIWWHTAHFALWGNPELTQRNLEWFVRQLPQARERAASRGLQGARWAKMVGIDGRESPGGNPLIAWNQPHLIYLCELLRRQSPAIESEEKYRALVLETAACMAAMLHFDAQRQQYVLGPPLWIAQEIGDQATSQNPSFELAYWHWALGIAQQWRERAGLGRDAHWDEIRAHLPPLPQQHGKYVALESMPDTWDNLASRHDHPQMLMPLGFLPETPYVDRATMDRTLTGVLTMWDWDTKIWGWDYPMVAMTAARLGRPAEAVEILLRDGPNNRYAPNGHCPQGSDEARRSQSATHPEIAVYLPANGSFLAAAALMIAGWDGCTEEFPGIPKDGTWKVRAEGLQRSP